MKSIYITALLFIVGCSSTKDSIVTANEMETGKASVTLRKLVYVDMSAPDYTTQHPLLCTNYYPDGSELIFKHPGKDGYVHAVFPKGVTAPQKNELTNTFTLHGHFQTIETNTNHDNKAPQKSVVVKKRITVGYQYFLVSSWEFSK